MNSQQKSALVVSLLAGIAAIYLAVDLYTLYENDQLWGQRVLWFWLSVWATIVGLRFGLKKTSKIQQQLFWASSLSGLLLAAGFMPMPTFFLMFVAFIPLLWVEEHWHQDERLSHGTLWRLVFNSFWLWNVLSTWWIQNSSFIAGFIGNTLNAIFMTLPFIAYHFTKQRMGQRAANFGFISYWLTFEIIHMTWDISWPWLTLGNSFAHLPSLVQWYEYTGIYGGSLWILGLNIWLYNNWLHYKTHQQLDWSRWWKPALVFALPIVISLVIYQQHDPTATGRATEVVTVQPNYEPHYQKFTVPQHEQLARFMQLIDTAVRPTTAYVVCPETSFRRIQARKVAESGVIKSFQQAIKKWPQLNMMLGLSAFIRYEEGERYPSNVYTYCNEDQSICQYIDAHNAAIQLNNEGTEIPYYQKSKLVPGAESMPYIGNIDLFKGLILDLGGAPGLSLGTQPYREVFASQQGQVAPLICYESIYGGYVTDYIKAGAEALFVITNDGWWDNTIGHRQHMYLSSLRAIETRRYVVRSANTGISCFINSRGDIYHPSEYETTVALRDTIYLKQGRTFYSYYGDLIGRVSILLSAWLLVSIISNKLRGPKEE